MDTTMDDATLKQECEQIEEELFLKDLTGPKLHPDECWEMSLQGEMQRGMQRLRRGATANEKIATRIFMRRQDLRNKREGRTIMRVGITVIGVITLGIVLFLL